jgi:hypothetical protein
LLLVGPAAAQPAMEGGRPLSATLSGAAEVPGPGDPDGTGTAKITANLGQKRICYELTVANIDPATMAHIHRGGAIVAGPVVVTLSPPTGGSSQGCVENVAEDLVKAIIQTPEGYYVNVHNATYPAGAVRGQLGK